MVVQHADKFDLQILNTRFKKSDKMQVTYKRGGAKL